MNPKRNPTKQIDRWRGNPEDATIWPQGSQPQAEVVPTGEVAAVSKSERRYRDRRSAAVCAFLIVAVAMVFGQTVGHTFLDYDDQDYVFENPHVRAGLTLDGIAWAFTHIHACNWHPLTWLSHMLDCQLFGLWAGGHHLTNVAIHAVTAVLLFLLLRSMTGDLWPSAFVAAVFAVHPQHVESVAWVAERKDVLSGLFFVLTLMAYVGYVRRPFSPARYGLVMAPFAGGLMSKPMLVTVPCVLLLLDYWPLGRLGAAADNGTAWLSAARRLLIEKLPLLALAVASCGVTLLAQRGAMAPDGELGFTSRIANALVSYVSYLGQFMYPTGLAVFYPHFGDSLPARKALVAATLVAAICLAAAALRRQCPYFIVGWLWFLGMLVPVIGLVQVGGQARADRYMYLPQIGLLVALAWGAKRAWQSSRAMQWISGLALAIILALLIACAWIQTGHWRNSETLWTHALTSTPKNPVAYTNLGDVYAFRDEGDKAIECYREALRISPDHAVAHNNLGMALEHRGQVGEALIHFQKAVDCDPNFAKACSNLARVLAGRSQDDAAVARFQEVLRNDPTNAEAYCNLAEIQARRRRFDEAVTLYRKALAINSDQPAIHNKLGVALLSQGRFDEAIEHFQAALKNQPDLVAAHYNWGNALARREEFDEAIAHYEKALAIKPDYAAAHTNLGNSLRIRGRLSEAIAHFRKAVELQPNSADARANLESAQSELSDKSRAANRQSPDH